MRPGPDDPSNDKQYSVGHDEAERISYAPKLTAAGRKGSPKMPNLKWAALNADGNPGKKRKVVRLVAIKRLKGHNTIEHRVISANKAAVQKLLHRHPLKLDMTAIFFYILIFT